MVATGFDYRRQAEVKRPLRDWRADAGEVIAAGGRRRVVNGETFVHSRGGALLFEVYAYVAEPKRRA